MKIKLIKQSYIVWAIFASCAFSAAPANLTGVWKIARGTVRGKDVDAAKSQEYAARVDETTWVEFEDKSNRSTTYYYKTENASPYSRIKLCHDEELKKIEALGIFKIEGGVLEICMIDYSSGVDYPASFTSTQKNGYKLIKLFRE